MSSTDIGKKQLSFVFRYALQSLAIIVGLAIVIRILLLASFVMSGASMLPSIWPGDFLLGFKWGTRDVKRGDIVALRCPHQKERTCLKRVVGLAGDRIEFHRGFLVINGRAARIATRGQFVTESLGGSQWTVWSSERGSNRKVEVVPPHHVYLLNDKREEPEDSRNWGSVHVNLIDARIKWIWLSLEWYEGQRIRSWPKLRMGRLLRSID